MFWFIRPDEICARLDELALCDAAFAPLREFHAKTIDDCTHGDMSIN
jgi:hypothetical protein